MRYAEATDLENGGGLPRNSDLPKRLAMAYELTRSVRRLHEKGVVIGDLAHDNLIVFSENWALYLIDLDGVHFDWDNHQYPLLANNSSKGAICPPEYSSKVKYTVTMDLWCVAVILHYFLTSTDPISLFGLARTYASTKQLTWPPPNHPKRESHLETLRLFGEPLMNAFLRVFNEGRLKPAKRPTAFEWEQMLVQAQQYMYLCYSAPDKPFVALDNAGKMIMECPNFCPNCPTPVMARPR
jgi:serine/threonine protein kinase